MMRPLVLFFTVVLLSACSDFNRALKSTDLDYKWKVAQEYYDKESWDRAIPLMEELIVLTRGTQRSQEVNYKHAKAHFNMKDYTLAAYYLANFVRTFPTSPFAEECSFLSAYCYFKNSPNFELDQADTRAAIDQMQLFMVRYPARVRAAAEAAGRRHSCRRPASGRISRTFCRPAERRPV